MVLIVLIVCRRISLGRIITSPPKNTYLCRFPRAAWLARGRGLLPPPPHFFGIVAAQPAPATSSRDFFLVFHVFCGIRNAGNNFPSQEQMYIFSA